MGRAPCCDKANVKRGPWSPEEDATLKTYLETHGTGGNWIALPRKAGLRRCGKSCRLRWLNYLRPDIKHGGFTEEEDHIICNLYNQMGSRWSVIASQLAGRTDNDVKNYWNTKLKKKLLAGKISLTTNNNTIPTKGSCPSSTTDHLSGSKPSFQPLFVPKLETNTEYSPFPNSQTTTLRMLSADVNYNIPGLTVYDQRLSSNNPTMDFSDHQIFDVNSKKNCDIINGPMSQEGSSISDSTNSMAASTDHHHNFERASLLSGINGCDEYGAGTTLMDFGFGLLPYDIVNDVSFEEKAAYNSIGLADHQSIINHY